MKKLAVIALILLGFGNSVSAVPGMSAEFYKGVSEDPVRGAIFTIGAPTFLPSMTLIFTIGYFCEYVGDNSHLTEEEVSARCAEAMNHPGLGISVSSASTQIFTRNITLSDARAKEILAAANDDAALFVSLGGNGLVVPMLNEGFELLNQDAFLSRMNQKQKAEVILILNQQLNPI